MDQLLEIAALACAAVGFILLLVRASGQRLPRQATVLRFRRSMKRLDSVVDRWAMEMQPRPERRPDELAVDPYRPERRRDADS